MRNHSQASILAAILLASCSASPRVSTPTERQTALAALTVVDVGLAAALAAGKITPAMHVQATGQVNELRVYVMNSEHEPVQWADMFARIAALALAWVPVKGS